MSVVSQNQRVMNVPNQLSLMRLLLSIVLFVLIAFQYYLSSLAVFVVAAGTDWLDGYWARKYGQVTNLGRILDPFVDKVIICGTFIFLAAIPTSGVQAWMAVLIVARELLVTALRSYLEGEGADFSAVMSGKLKMAVQCLAVVVSLFALHFDDHHHHDPDFARPDQLTWVLTASVWAAVLLTIYSGIAYIRRAIALLTR